MKQIEVVAGLIFREGRLLVCQRKKNGDFSLKWEFPGGKVEKGERHEDALRRELREELGIAIGELSEISRHSHTYSGAYEVHLRFYRVREFFGEVKNNAFNRITWVKVSELKTLDFLDGDRPLIKSLAGC